MVSPTITVASREDLPALAEINRAAYSRETISRFGWKNWPDEKNMLAFLTSRIAQRLDQPRSKIFKASDPDSGNIYGFVIFTLENAPAAAESVKQPVVDVSATAAQNLSEFMNMDFLAYMQKEMGKLRSDLMEEQHYYLSAFAVSPADQGKGIGSQLLEHCLRIADQAGLRTWLNAFPGSHSLYLRHGFTDVMHHDVDLNEWDKNRLRGYGIYRSYLMAREPQKLDSENN
ncbi:acyl-CoA N-acyltransferase [Thozetella sp. PMI_491]|nr:acyl-CoA N-acyltransferase [Thozetella sp. PMI_491]